jgi:phytoene synthase
VSELTDLGRETIRVGSRSFATASALLDRSAREGAWRLYAWCRHCDDVIDGQEFGHGAAPPVQAEQVARLAELTALTKQALQGDTPVPPVFEALRGVVREAGVDPRRPIELLEGFAMDVERRRFDRLEDTLRYAYHVAGVVGVMMAQVMGVRDRQTLDRACDLGIAFQLTNIARDVMEDARVGRVYLPADWLASASVAAGPEGVLDPSARPAVAEVVRRLLAEADGYYASSRAGIARLPLRAAWGVAAARGIYRDIGHIVRSQGAAAWAKRASPSKARTAYLVGRGGAVAIGARLPVWSWPRDGLWTMPD